MWPAQAPRKPVQEPAHAGKGTHGAKSHSSSVENGAGAAAPHSSLPPLPASVGAAPGTRNPSDVTCPARPSGTAWRHKQGPAQPAWHLGARGRLLSRARQHGRHFRDTGSCRGTKMHLFHGKGKDFTLLQALKAGQSVNYPEFTGSTSLDRDKPLQKPFSPSSF